MSDELISTPANGACSVLQSTSVQSPPEWPSILYSGFLFVVPSHVHGQSDMKSWTCDVMQPRKMSCQVVPAIVQFRGHDVVMLRRARSLACVFWISPVVPSRYQNEHRFQVQYRLMLKTPGLQVQANYMNWGKELHFGSWTLCTITAHGLYAILSIFEINKNQRKKKKNNN